MTGIVKDYSLDNTLAFMREGYAFISNRCRQYQTDIFETRIMMQKATCVMGKDAARMFYKPRRFTRKFALPPMALFLLQDLGSVALRDGSHHRRRKQMFMSLMTPESIQHLMDLVHEQWQFAISSWERKPQIILHYEVEGILCRAICEWAGILPLEEEAEQRTKEFSAMIEGAGAIGMRFLHGLKLRSRTENWARSMIQSIRKGDIQVKEESAAFVISHHRDEDGQLLDIATAAVELINILRPTVAVARYITFAATAMETFPEWKEKLASADDELIEVFVQEVRRYYPFFPAVGGRALEAFEWRGNHFAIGSWFLLDLYGTNHDPRIWANPYSFQPERFVNWEGNPFTLIPQGGGDFYAGHRCPGEWITIELIKTSVRVLASAMDYRVPMQDLGYSLSRMPAIPRSKFIMNQVTRKHHTSSQALHTSLSNSAARL